MYAPSSTSITRNQYLLANSICCLLACSVFSSCAGSRTDALNYESSRPALSPIARDSSRDWPVLLPEDRVQPWETQDDQGRLIPGERVSSALPQNHDLIPGVDRFRESGGVTDLGEASHVESLPGTLAYAMYRIPLFGGQPAVASVDVNLLGGEGYYLGLSNYADQRWEWHGPFAGNHTQILPRHDGPYTSQLGSMFLTVLVAGVASADVVAIGTSVRNPLDVEAPPVPAGLVATAVQGGLLLEWNSVTADDIAGYRIYHSDHPFVNGDSAGVSALGSLVASTTHQLTAKPDQEIFLRLAALDMAGNESGISESVSTIPLPGNAPELLLNLANPSCPLHDSIELTFAGGQLYDLDMDGDGIFEVTDNSSGTAFPATSSPGIVRPAVRGFGTEADAVVIGSVSMLVSDNLRPSAIASASPSSGFTPLSSFFSGTDSTDSDGSIVGGGWDFDGDGFYEAWEDADLVYVTSTEHTYIGSGMHTARLGIVDDQGGCAKAYVSVDVFDEEPGNLTPTADLQIAPEFGDVGDTFTLDASASNDPDGHFIKYEWDFDGDGTYDDFGVTAAIEHVYDEHGLYVVIVRVTDNAGGKDTATAEVLVNEVFELDTAWPAWGRDIRHTRRSPYQGPQTDNVQWDFTTGSLVLSSPSIAEDGTVYIGSYDGNLYAINPDGSQKWAFPTGSLLEATAAIAEDGTIYVGNWTGVKKFFAINPDGTEKWSFTAAGSILSSAAICTDGTIYVGCGSAKFYAINPDGSEKWTYNALGIAESSPAIAPDGTIYIGGSVLHAINPNGSNKWTFVPVGNIRASPAIGTDGTIYVGTPDNFFYAINPDGSEKWCFEAEFEIVSSAAIAADGTIYIGSFGNHLYALNPDGTIKWEYFPGGNMWSSPVIDSEGTVYFGVSLGQSKVVAVGPDGSFKWSRDMDGMINSSPAIAADGSMYVGSQDGKVYAFGLTLE